MKLKYEPLHVRVEVFDARRYDCATERSSRHAP